MVFENFVFLIGNFGFPIAMVLYFVLRFEKILQNQTDTLNNMITKSEQEMKINKKLIEILEKKNI